MQQSSTHVLVPEARLASWKAIAAYLGRSPRTVQRWLADYGLPVHRLGGSTGPIFAYRDELDAWLRNRGHARKLPPQSPESPRTSESQDPPGRPIAVTTSDEDPGVFDFPSAPGWLKGRSAELTTLAQGMWETLSSPDFSTSVRVFRDAIDLDPANARALAGLSFVLLVGGLLTNQTHPVYASAAEDALRRALEIEPESVQVESAHAWIRMIVHRDWKTARRRFKDALARNPQFGPALVGEALLHIAERKLAEASDQLLEACTQSPLSSPTLLLRVWNAYLSGNSASGLELLAQARSVGHSGALMDALQALASVDPGDHNASLARLLTLAASPSSTYLPHPVLLGALGYCHAAVGRTGEAQMILQGFLQVRSQDKENYSYPLALVFVGLNDRANAVRWLKQSYSEGSLWSLGFLSDPLLASLRKDPIYQNCFGNFSSPSPEDSASRLASAS